MRISDVESWHSKSNGASPFPRRWESRKAEWSERPVAVSHSHSPRARTRPSGGRHQCPPVALFSKTKKKFAHPFSFRTCKKEESQIKKGSPYLVKYNYFALKEVFFNLKPGLKAILNRTTVKKLGKLTIIHLFTKIGSLGWILAVWQS